MKKTTTRKSQAKKANAPMKNAPAAKPADAATKSAASKAAKTMAKTVQPGVRKSAARRVEKAEKKLLSATAQKKLDQIKITANSLCFCIRQDAKAAAKGQVSIETVRKHFKAVQQMVLDARIEMYKDLK